MVVGSLINLFRARREISVHPCSSRRGGIKPRQSLHTRMSVHPCTRMSVQSAQPSDTPGTGQARLEARRALPRGAPAPATWRPSYHTATPHHSATPQPMLRWTWGLGPHKVVVRANPRR